MIYYIASENYQNLIANSIQDCDEVLAGQEIGNEIYLLKYIKSNLTKFAELEKIVVDLSAVEDTDDEIVTALENLRVMYENLRIIVLGTNRVETDPILERILQANIVNIVCTNDYLELKEELKYCIQEGKTYRDALEFKEASLRRKDDTPLLPVAKKILVGLAGSQNRIGVTHQAICLANTLRKKGFMVALVEMNLSGDFEDIRDSFDENPGEYFNVNGIDFYPNADVGKLSNVIGKTYNFVLADFGRYDNCDLVSYHKANIRICITGSKPWELDALMSTFELTDPDNLLKIDFCFNYTRKDYEKEIRKNMIDNHKNALRCHFIPYSEDPFTTCTFVDFERIFQEYLVPLEKPGKKKHRLFRNKEELA